MIIYNENTLFTNNKYHKIKTFNSYKSLRPKKQRKKIIVLNFFYYS